MRGYFDISVQRVLRECVTQTSLDLQSLRSNGGESVLLADSIYDDWTINEDNKPEVLTPLQDFSATLASSIKDRVCHYNCGMDIISWAIDIEDATQANTEIINNALLRYYKYNVLAWWYLLRNTELSNVYRSMANNALADIISSIGLNKSRLVGHYF